MKKSPPQDAPPQMDNRSVAGVLNQIGAILEIKDENPFKVRAYYTGARNVEALTEPIGKVVEENRLREIPGIGEALQQKITELVQTGRLKYLDEILKTLPSGLLDLLRIPSVGPKKVKILFEKLKVTGIEDLEKACRENRLIDLEGFGEKTQQKILEGIQFVSQHRGRFRLGDARPIAEEVVERMEQCPAVRRVSLAGSLRRWKEVVKDMDIVASSKKPDEVMDFFVQLPQVAEVIAKGPTKSSVRFQNGIAADLRVVADDEFAYAMHHFTGSKEHNVAMRARAQKMGLKINEYGLFKGARRIPCKDEEEFFKALKLKFIPPELRENMGEIEASEKNELPDLIEPEDIKGVLHVHSTWSDGTASIAQMAEAARRLGFEYMGLSDHSQEASYANGLDEARLKKQWEEIDGLNKKVKGFKILKGMELDILADGSLDLDEKMLAQLDFAIGSIHSRFTMPEEEMTARVIKAIANPHLDIFAHPTGRLLLDREGYRIDLDKVLDAVKKYDKVIELNANPHRLDLDWIHARRARDKGVKLSINPDAHSTKGLADVRFGVATARRAWLRKEDVINTRSCQEVLRVFVGDRVVK